MADTPAQPTFIQTLGGLLTGQSQPTVNTNIIIEEKSYQKALLSTTAAILFLILVWYIGMYLTRK